MRKQEWRCSTLIHLPLYIFQIVLTNVFDVMLKAVMVVPRVETKLYSEWVSIMTLDYNVLVHSLGFIFLVFNWLVKKLKILHSCS